MWMVQKKDIQKDFIFIILMMLTWIFFSYFAKDPIGSQAGRTTGSSLNTSRTSELQ